MRAYVCSAIILLGACRDRPSDDPRATASASASASVRKLPLPVVGGNCTNVCRKALRCMDALNTAEHSACLSLCQDGTPDPVLLSNFHGMDCEMLVTKLKAGSDGTGSPGVNIGTALAALALKRGEKDATSTP